MLIPDNHDKFITIAFDKPSGKIGNKEILKDNGFEIETSKVMKLEKKNLNLIKI